jgi:hypothetical protein
MGLRAFLFDGSTAVAAGRLPEVFPERINVL